MAATDNANEFTPIEKVKFEQRGWKPPQQTMGGDGPILIYPSVSDTDRNWVQFSIYAPPENSVIAIDINKDNQAEIGPKRLAELQRMPMIRTDFHVQPTGFRGEAHKGNNRRVYITNISPEIYKRFQDIDEANIKALVKNSMQWFNRQLSEEGVRLGYVPCATEYPNRTKVDDPSKCVPAIACRLDVRPERMDVYVQSADAYNVLNPGTYMDVPRGARVIPYFTDSGVFIRKMESGAQIMLSSVVVLDGVNNNSRPKPKVSSMGFTVSAYRPSPPPAEHHADGGSAAAGSFDGFSTMAQQGSALAAQQGGDFFSENTQVGGVGFGQALMY